MDVTDARENPSRDTDQLRRLGCVPCACRDGGRQRRHVVDKEVQSLFRVAGQGFSNVAVGLPAPGSVAADHLCRGVPDFGQRLGKRVGEQAGVGQKRCEVKPPFKHRLDHRRRAGVDPGDQTRRSGARRNFGNGLDDRRFGGFQGRLIAKREAKVGGADIDPVDSVHPKDPIIARTRTFSLAFRA